MAAIPDWWNLGGNSSVANQLGTAFSGAKAAVSDPVGWAKGLASGMYNSANNAGNRALGTFGLEAPPVKDLDPMKAPEFQSADSADARARMMALIDQLNNSANGVGPSLAQLQLQQATDRNQRQSMGLAQALGHQGVGYGAALRGALGAQAQEGQQAAGQSAIARLMEQQQARQLLGSLLGGTRAQDIDIGKGNQEWQGKTGMFNTEAAQKQAALREAQRQSVVNARMGLVNTGLNTMSGFGQGLLSLGKLGSTSLPNPAQGTAPTATSGGDGGGGDSGGSDSDLGGDYALGGLVQHLWGGGVPHIPTGGLLSEVGGTFTPPANPFTVPAGYEDEFKEDPTSFWTNAGTYGARGATGGAVAGRANVAGDSPDNDTVRALLSPGEIVLPRSVAQAEDAPGRAAAFVQAVKRQKRGAK